LRGRRNSRWRALSNIQPHGMPFDGRTWERWALAMGELLMLRPQAVPIRPHSHTQSETASPHWSLSLLSGLSVQTLVVSSRLGQAVGVVWTRGQSSRCVLVCSWRPSSFTAPPHHAPSALMVPECYPRARHPARRPTSPAAMAFLVPVMGTGARVPRFHSRYFTGPAIRKSRKPWSRSLCRS